MTLPGWLKILGLFFGLCTLVAIVKTAIDAYRESGHAKWTRVVATITQQTVQQTLNQGASTSVRRYFWYIQSGVRYRVEGEELTSSIRSRVTYSAEDRNLMREWASRHPPGTSLAIRYDPRRPATVVTDAGDMPESGPQRRDDLKLVLIFLVSSVACAIAGRVARAVKSPVP